MLSRQTMQNLYMFIRTEFLVFQAHSKQYLVNELKPCNICIVCPLISSSIDYLQRDLRMKCYVHKSIFTTSEMTSF